VADRWGVEPPGEQERLVGDLVRADIMRDRSGHGDSFRKCCSSSLDKVAAQKQEQVFGDGRRPLKHLNKVLSVVISTRSDISLGRSRERL
jgi:hypothetical protein